MSPVQLEPLAETHTEYLHLVQLVDQVYRCRYVQYSTHFLLWLTTYIAIPGSFLFTMLFLPLYAVVAPAIGFSTEYRGIVPRLWTDGVFYFVLLLVPIFCLSRDFAWK